MTDIDNEWSIWELYRDQEDKKESFMNNLVKRIEI